MEEKRDTQSDEDLMVLYQNGDSAAFECLYQRHSGRVFEYIKKKVASSAAQELVQETFMKVHRSRHQYSEQYPFLPWLFTISRSVLLDHFKAAETRVSERSVNGDRLMGQLHVAEANSSSHDLQAVLGSLPAQQRRAIELRYLSEWTFEKIASEMKTSPENSRQLISRGLKKLRSLLQGGEK